MAEKDTVKITQRAWHSEETEYGLNSGEWDPMLPVGPRRLLPVAQEAQTEAMARLVTTLLGPEADLVEAASSTLVPYRSNGHDQAVPRVFVPSASEQIGAYGGEIHYYTQKGRAIGIDPAIVAREVLIATPGDLFIGRSDPFREVMQGNPGVEYHDLGQKHEEMYYTVEKLLELALTHGEDGNPINEIVDSVRLRLGTQPETVFRVYTLDEPMQLFLVWLARQAGVSKLNVEANGVEGSKRNHKGYAYPTLKAAETVDIGNLNPNDPDDLTEILAREGKKSQLESELGISIPRMPGYYIPREWDTGEDLETYTKRVTRAAQRMLDLYGLESVCLKHARSSDGAGVTPHLSLEDDSRLRDVVRDAYNANQELIIEPTFNYYTITIGDNDFILAPSAHLSNGASRDGMTLQLIIDGEWQGNVDVDLRSEALLGNSEYTLIIETMRRLAEAITYAEEAGTDIGIRKGGIDWAYGTIGGKFGDTPFMVPQDLNFRTSGAETHYSVSGQRPDAHTATKVLKPQPGAEFTSLQETISALCGELKVLVKPGWGYMAVHHSENGLEAAEACLEIEKKLRDLNLVA